MSGEEFVLAVIAIVMGASVAIVGITKFTSLIRAWINRNHGGYEEESFARLAKAFLQHKKDSERRLQNLEAIITDDDYSSATRKSVEAPKNTIEIVDDEKEEKKKDNRGNLRNMLRE